MHTGRWASKRCFFFQLKYPSFLCVAFFLLPSGMHRYAQNSYCSYFSSLSQNTARLGKYRDGLDITFIEPSFRRAFFFFSFVAEFLVPLFFGSGYICITDTPRETESFDEVYKIIGGKDSEGAQEKERLSETDKERELLFGIRYLGIMVFVSSSVE